MKKFGLAVLAIAVSVLSATPALAQYEGGTTVPPQTTTSTIGGTTTTTAGGTTTTAPGGGTTTTAPGGGTTIPTVNVTTPGPRGQSTGLTLLEDQSSTLAFCGFAPGSPVNVSWNGAFVLTKNADSGGCITVLFQYVDDDDPDLVLGRGVSLAAVRVPVRQLAQATGATVRIDGRTLAGVVGNNTITATGTASDGAPLTVTTSVNLASQATSVAQRAQDAAAAGSTGGGLPRTGVMILRWSMVGLSLLGVGALLVALDRRRTSTTA